ncbi:MAG: ABC transporter substrate-binding protein [Dehalococcoidia bacterium]
MRKDVNRVALGAVVALLAGITVAGFAGAAAGSETRAAQADPIVLGFAIGRSGWMAPYDVPPLQGAQLAVSELNARGGILRRQLKIITSDTKTETDLLASAGIEVLDKGADFLVASCDFDQGGPAATVAQQRGVVAISTCAGSNKFGPQGIGNLAFTMGSAGATQGVIMAEWSYQRRGFRRAYILYNPALDYHRQVEAGFETRWKQLGGRLLGKDTKQTDDQSVATQIAKIRSLSPQPDVLFLADFMPSLGVATRQIRAAGINIPIASGGENFDGNAWKAGVPNASNIYFTTYTSIYGDDPDPSVNQFYRKFRTKLGKLPPSGAAVTGYAVVQAIARAVTRAKTTEGKAVARQLEKFRNEKLLAGPTTFTKNAHIAHKRTARILQVQRGKTSFLTLHTPKVVVIPKT